jgi:Domain of unknown function (DUF4114)/Subtilase family/Calx-beta domain
MIDTSNLLESYSGLSANNNSLLPSDNSFALTPSNTISGLSDPLGLGLRSLASASFNYGAFTVGETGKVSFDYLFDGGGYKGELAIFSLTGMDRWLQADSNFFAKEAALRALSDTDLGHVVISDRTEDARFSNGLPDNSDFKSGQYMGTKTFLMRPGEQFGVMLVPNGTVEDVLYRRELGGNRTPLFSVPILNASGATQFAQLIDVRADGNSFAFEDLSLNGHSDRDYNDMIFQIQGAVGAAASLNSIINPAKDWRKDDFGQQVLKYAAVNEHSPLSSMSLALAGVYIEYESYLRNGGSPSTFQPSSSLVQVINGNVLIEAVASKSTASLLTDLKALGLQQDSSYEPMVSGLLPIEAINDAATLSNLAFARPAYHPISQAGTVISQGDRSMRTDTARANFNVDGQGVTVGVISNSYNTLPTTATNPTTGAVRNFITAANDIANIAPDGSRDLPANVTVLQDKTTGNDWNYWTSPSADEGRAMLQLVHDIAPGANLMFHTGEGGDVEFANAILALANAGAQVIVDDLRSFYEPMFQDGIIAQAVDRVVNNQGVAYFSSAGNYGSTGYESIFNPTNQLTLATGQVLSGVVAHDFDPDPARVNPLQSITIGAGERIFVSLQWDEPFRSASPIGSPGSSGATTDLNIYLYDATGNLISQSVQPNSGQDPLEVLEFTNRGATRDFNLVITSPSNVPAGRRIRYQMFDRDGVFVNTNTFLTNSPTIYGHANATSALAVGAAYYQNTPRFGINPAVLEDFSSTSSVPILFDTAGNRLSTPQFRQNPGIVAPDGTNTTFFGSDSDGDGFPNFFGTSAAAPHAAAVAALMLQAVPAANPTNIYQALQDTALDMDALGWDNATGHGLIQADRAIARLRELELPTITITAPDNTASESGDTAQFVVTRTGGNINRAVLVNYTLGGTASNGKDYAESSAPDLPPIPLNGTVLIPAGVSSVSIPITAIDDKWYEPANETLEITLSQSDSYIVGSANRDTITITDNERPKGVLTLSINYIQEIGGLESWLGGKPDFYAETTIGDQRFSRDESGEFNDSFFIPNNGWQHFNAVIGDENDAIPIVIGLYNENGGLLGKTQRVDINPLPGDDNRVLGVGYNLRTGKIVSGEITNYASLPTNDGGWSTLAYSAGNEKPSESALVVLDLKFTPSYDRED